MPVVINNKSFICSCPININKSIKTNSIITKHLYIIFMIIFLKTLNIIMIVIFIKKRLNKH